MLSVFSSILVAKSIAETEGRRDDARSSEEIENPLRKPNSTLYLRDLPYPTLSYTRFFSFIRALIRIRLTPNFYFVFRLRPPSLLPSQHSSSKSSFRTSMETTTSSSDQSTLSTPPTSRFGSFGGWWPSSSGSGEGKEERDEQAHEEEEGGATEGEEEVETQHVGNGIHHAREATEEEKKG